MAEKSLEGYNDVFADIVNGLLFQGGEVISAEELEDRLPYAHYKADGKLREMERDVLKQWKTQKLRLALLGFENQTDPDPDMPLRVMGYDGAEYRAQLSEQKSGERFPVITLVLYFGHNKRWGRATSLLERLSIPEKFRPFVSDYKINVFEIAYLTQEQVNLFKSDFRVVADYFVQKRENGDYVPNTQELKHVQETLRLLSVMTGDHRFEEAYNDKNVERSPCNMCDVLDRIENRGIKEGFKQGIKQGIEQKEAQFIQNMYRKGFSLEQIADVAEKTVEEVKSIVAQEKPLLS